MEVETNCGTRVQQELVVQFAFGTNRSDVAGPTGEANLNDPSVMTLLLSCTFLILIPAATGEKNSDSCGFLQIPKEFLKFL